VENHYKKCLKKAVQYAYEKRKKQCGELGNIEIIKQGKGKFLKVSIIF